jgi:sulfatase modifying factor 1
LTADGIARNTVTRNAGWSWAVASEDEWYKAAYYKGGGTNAGYWVYATKSDVAPSNVGSDGYADPGNHANYHALGYAFTIGFPYCRTIVGEFENSASAYGTFDQDGNVWEWSEAIRVSYGDHVYRGVRGGSWGDSGYLRASEHYDSYRPTSEQPTIGFRVVRAVPEPSSTIALLCGLAGLLAARRRRV